MDRYPHTAAGSLFAACDIRVVAEERRAGEVDTLDPVPEEQGLILRSWAQSLHQRLRSQLEIRN